MLVLLFLSLALCTTVPPGTVPGGATIAPTDCTLQNYGSGACQKCLDIPGCGWCASQRQCFAGTAVGPTVADSACLQGWYFNASDKPFCPNCAARQGCVECSRYPDCLYVKNGTTGLGACYDRALVPGNQVPLSNQCQCHLHSSCRACAAEGSCSWCENKKRCFGNDQTLPAGCSANQTCPACENVQLCQNCLQTPGCGWCGSKCLPSTSCNSGSNPPALLNCDSYCRAQTDCEPCIFSPGCGWCEEYNRCEGMDMLKLLPCKFFAVTCPRPSSFDAGSFFGGAALVIGLGAAAVITFFVIKKFRRSSYSQL